MKVKTPKEEPKYMCPMIDQIQNDLAQLYDKLKDQPGFEPDGEHWDTIMACLYNLDNLRLRIESLRAWGSVNNSVYKVIVDDIKEYFKRRSN